MKEKRRDNTYKSTAYLRIAATRKRRFKQNKPYYKFMLKFFIKRISENTKFFKTKDIARAYLEENPIIENPSKRFKSGRQYKSRNMRFAGFLAKLTQAGEIKRRSPEKLESRGAVYILDLNVLFAIMKWENLEPQINCAKKGRGKNVEQDLHEYREHISFLKQIKEVDSAFREKVEKILAIPYIEGEI